MVDVRSDTDHNIRGLRVTKATAAKTATDACSWSTTASDDLQLE
jgi:hypothetical protein